MVTTDALFFFRGLLTTFWISAAGIVLSLVLFVAIKPIITGQITFLKKAVMTIITFIDSIPLLLQLYVVFFMLPAYMNIYVNSNLIAIIVLGMNSVAGITKHSIDNVYIRTQNKKQKQLFYGYAIIGEFGEMFKNTTLLSMFGIVELTKYARDATASTANGAYMLFAVGVYIFFGIIFSLVKSILRNKMKVLSQE